MVVFGLLAAIFCAIGLVLGIFVIVDFAQHANYVTKVPTAILSVSFVFIGILNLATGMILGSVVKSHRLQYELEVNRIYDQYRK